MEPEPPLSIPPAKLLSHLSHTHTIPGKLKVTELLFQVPLDHTKPKEKQIRIFCRAAERSETPIVPKPGSDTDDTTDKPPWLVFINGGPGFGAPQPQDAAWTQILLDKGYRILYFDHRGMGLSTPVTAATLHAHSSDPQIQADYLCLHRADNAVRDLEAIRLTLTADQPADRQKWSIMGQSYGGFVCLTYLSFYSAGLREAFVFGGLAPITQTNPDEVVRRLSRRVRDRNHQYYARYPEDRARVSEIVRHLLSREQQSTQNTQYPDFVLHEETPLTARHFLSIGITLGFQNGFARIHDCVLRASNDLGIFGFLTRPTVSRVQEVGMTFTDVPLYGVLHEAIYCQGEASRWSFDRVLDETEEFGLPMTELPAHLRVDGSRTGTGSGAGTDTDTAVTNTDTMTATTINTTTNIGDNDNHNDNDSNQSHTQPPPPNISSSTTTTSPSLVLFTGEFPLRHLITPPNSSSPLISLQTLEILHSHPHWPPLYNLLQLSKNTVPVFAAVYLDDLYVDFGFSMETAAIVKRCRTYVTNGMLHDAVRTRVEEVVDKVWGVREDCIE